MSPSSFYDFARRELSYAKRMHFPLTLCVIDFTESFAEASMLTSSMVEFALVFRNNLRSDEVIARLGYEKFAIVIHGSLSDSEKLHDRLWRAINLHQRENSCSAHYGVGVVMKWRALESEPFHSVVEWCEAANI